MLRRSVLIATLVAAVAISSADPASASAELSAEARGGRIEPTVRARLVGWIGRRDGVFLYREGATVLMAVVVRPALARAKVRARLEWHRAGSRWRLLDVSTTRLSLAGRARFRIRRLPAGYAFRIRARVPPRAHHAADRSPWLPFRVR